MNRKRVLQPIVKKSPKIKTEFSFNEEPVMLESLLKIKQEPIDNLGNFSPVQSDGKVLKRKVKNESSVRVKKQKSSISLKSGIVQVSRNKVQGNVEPESIMPESSKVKQEPIHHLKDLSPLGKEGKSLKRKVKNESSDGVKKRNSSISLKTGIIKGSRNQTKFGSEKKKVLKEMEMKPNAGTSKLENFDFTDLKTENDIKQLNKVFQSDMRKKRQCFILSEVLNLSFDLTAKIMGLFDSDATIPFVVRYRQHIIQNLSPEELRNFKHSYDYLNKVFDKAETMKKKLHALGHLNESLSSSIDSCTTLQELEYIYEPYKVSKSSKLMKVIDSGLVGPATAILDGIDVVNIDQIQTLKKIKPNEVMDLIVYYIAETMSKNTELLKRVQEIKKTERITLTCKQKKDTTKTEQKKKSNRPEDNYFNYYNFSQHIKRVRPYQVLAINRGEKEHCLQVALTFEDSFRHRLGKFALDKWYNKGIYYDLRKNIFNKAIEFMLNQRILPHLKRVIRSELTKEGEKAGLEVFSSNLKYLLLTPPIHCITVCAVDPGYNNGCKIAVLNAKQEVLTTDILYLNNPHHFALADCKLVKLMTDFNVELLALGNGKGCRDVENCLNELVKKQFLNENFKYIVVNERGVSIYSCSPDAKEEYPNYSPNVISAISLAKRVLDPLCEMVKVDPKHLGIGMYQHDISEKKLELELDEVVSECVSYVGVDINNAPLRILKRVAGLTDSKAKAIIQAREKNGSFINREALKEVKGIGPKTFQQCAGFIKIIPGTVSLKKTNTNFKTNPLAQTIIHPEDYKSVNKLLALNGLKLDDIGNNKLIHFFKSILLTQCSTTIAKDIDIPNETLKLILEALTKPLDYDLRSMLDKPIFRCGAKSIYDLHHGTIVSGQVENVTHFGAFVDIGIECSGLIPTMYCSDESLHLGHKVTVRVSEIDPKKMRVTLHLIKIDSTES